MSDTIPTIQAPARAARRHALERAYPLAKQLAEVLELEAIEPAATTVKRIRQAIGAELAEHGALDPLCLDAAERDALTRHALAIEDEFVEVGDGR